MCVGLYTDIVSHFFFGGEGDWGAEKHMIVRETGQIATTGACGGRKLRTDLQYIS